MFLGFQAFLESSRTKTVSPKTLSWANIHSRNHVMVTDTSRVRATWPDDNWNKDAKTFGDPSS